MHFLSKEFFNILAKMERGFTLRRVRDMVRTYSQMHQTNQYLQKSSAILQFG